MRITRTTYFTFMLWIIIISFSWMTLAHAVNFPNKPQSTDFYVDDANLISPQDKIEINQIISKLWNEKRVAMIVVTIPSLADENATTTTIQQYTRALFDFWGLGSQKHNNGIMLLVSKNDHQARIELGQSWGQRYNSTTDKIMQSDIIPQFKAGNYSTGILNGVIALSAMANGVYVAKSPLAQLSVMQVMISIVVIVFFIGLIISLFRNGRTGWGWALIIFLVLVLGWLLSNIRLGKGGGGSGGMFGGGSSGGGGSTGSW